MRRGNREGEAVAAEASRAQISICRTFSPIYLAEAAGGAGAAAAAVAGEDSKSITFRLAQTMATTGAGSSEEGEEAEAIHLAECLADLASAKRDSNSSNNNITSSNNRGHCSPTSTAT